MNLEKFRLFVFDFDGTIKNTNQIKEEAFVEIADRHNIDKSFLKKALNIGGSRFEIFENLVDLSAKGDSAVMIEDFSRLVHKKICNCEHLPSAKEYLEHLKSNKENRVCILSATPHAELVAIIHEIYSATFFDAVLGTSNKIGALADLMQQFRCNPNSTVMFGDQFMDQEAAEKNHVKFVPVQSTGSWKNQTVPEEAIVDYAPLFKRP